MILMKNNTFNKYKIILLIKINNKITIKIRRFDNIQKKHYFLEIY